MIQNYPLLETAEIVTEDDRISLVQTIEPKKYHYLFDHKFGGKLFMPATGIMEYFGEAASFWVNYQMQKNYTVRELLNLNIERAIAIDPDSNLAVELKYVSTEISDSQVSVSMEIYSKRINSKNIVVGTRLNASCSVIMTAKGYGEFPATAKYQEPNTQWDCYKFPTDKYYGFYYPSHGPLFQSLTGRFKVSKDRTYIVGEYNCLNKQSEYVVGNKSPFLLSPLGYDSCLQYEVYLSRIRDLFGRLPISCPRVIVHCNHPTNEPCKVIVECVKIDDEIMDGNIQCFTQNGSLIMEAKVFRVQKAFFHKYTRELFDQPLLDHQVPSLDFNA